MAVLDAASVDQILRVEMFDAVTAGAQGGSVTVGAAPTPPPVGANNVLTLVAGSVTPAASSADLIVPSTKLQNEYVGRAWVFLDPADTNRVILQYVPFGTAKLVGIQSNARTITVLVGTTSYAAVTFLAAEMPAATWMLVEYGVSSVQQQVSLRCSIGLSGVQRSSSSPVAAADMAGGDHWTALRCVAQTPNTNRYTHVWISNTYSTLAGLDDGETGRALILLMLRPASDDLTLTWTAAVPPGPHYASVNESPPDDDASYVRAVGNSATTRQTLSDLYKCSSTTNIIPATGQNVAIYAAVGGSAKNAGTTSLAIINYSLQDALNIYAGGSPATDVTPSATAYTFTRRSDYTVFGNFPISAAALASSFKIGLDAKVLSTDELRCTAAFALFVVDTRTTLISETASAVEAPLVAATPPVQAEAIIISDRVTSLQAALLTGETATIIETPLFVSAVLVAAEPIGILERITSFQIFILANIAVTTAAPYLILVDGALATRMWGKDTFAWYRLV